MTKQLGYSKIKFLGYTYNKTSIHYNMELQLDDHDSVKFIISIDELSNPHLNQKEQAVLFVFAF